MSWELKVPCSSDRNEFPLTPFYVPTIKATSMLRTFGGAVPAFSPSTLTNSEVHGLLSPRV